MALIGLDFETKSGTDLITHGSMRYFKDPQADIVMLGHKIEDNETGLWLPHKKLPYFMSYAPEHTYYAFNAQFDRRAWNFLGKKYNFPEIKLHQWIDVMAICGRFSYPQALEKVGDVLGLKIQKDKQGKALMKKICSPPFKYTHNEFFEFMKYCITDVDTMHEMLYALPSSKLSDSEQAIWEMTVRINDRGIPIDIKAVEQITKVTDAYKIEQNKLLPDLTGGNVTKATQRDRIVRWLKRQGLIVPNLQAKTVEKLLQRLDLSDNVKLVLQLRQELGKSSTAKYQKLLDQCYKGRIYDNLRYAGANTLRWAGQGFQLHNLPRSNVKDAQPIVDKFFDLSIIEDNPVESAKSIIRGMICASEGNHILAADYSSIENRGLAWVSGDTKTLKLFEDGLDQYIDMAAHRFNVPYDEVTEEQRRVGKVLILGCGYGLGAVGYRTTCADQGMFITVDQSVTDIKAYRTRYKLVVKSWYACKDAAINAISSPGTEFETCRCKFKMVLDKNRGTWMQLTLPSGRAIYYNTPLIQEGKYGPEMTAMGIHPKIKQWMRLSVIPGRIVENIVQALCRDILAHGKLNLQTAGYDLIGSIHDEPILEINDTGRRDTEYLDYIYKHMCDTPKWLEDFPLKAEGFIAERYRKM